MSQRLIDRRTEYLACEKSSPRQVTLKSWERNLLNRVNQVCNKCTYARFILTVDSGRIILEQIGKQEIIKKQ